MEQEALKKAQAWASNTYFDTDSRQEIQNLIDKNDTKEIIERFYKDLEFGTGGIRSTIGMGNNMINIYTIRKATQALASEVKKAQTADPKVAISYDSRRKSFEFAKEAASVLAANGIHAYIYKRLNPVCLLSFSVRYHKAQAGIMITASHNPPEYNGYKVYWSDGCQVTAPNDKNIIDAYNAISDYSHVEFIPFDEGVEKGLIHWVGEDVENAYLNTIKEFSINPKLCKQKGTELKFVYTPIHGAGLIPCTKALNELGVSNYEVVEQQSKPDGNFPTVKSPNPENPEAMQLAVDLMKKNNADVAFASDPDADRLGVAINHHGDVRFINGNQIGTLLLHYILFNLKEQNRMPSSPYFVKTIVTTELQRTIADHFGVDTIDTLTGFKWICGKMRELEQNEPDRNFVFGTEESFGYLNHAHVRDKDGVAPITLLAEMSLWYKLKDMTLIDALEQIYEQFGFAHEALLNLNYYGQEGAAKIIRIMSKFREFSGDTFCSEKIVAIEDYQTGVRKNLTDGTTSQLTLPKSNVLGFYFTGDTKLYLRPSGTEPKIKFYLMIREKEGDLKKQKLTAKNKSDAFFKYLTEESDKA
ncbi:MAG: phospho-sugar mutase [Bacteriovoracaceae bacterium]|nr:phospho-sugar mutase [Bacteriovoracaceae bacterium]